MPTKVTTVCPECDTVLTGAPGAEGQCKYCWEWIAMPDENDLTDPPNRDTNTTTNNRREQQ